MPQSHKFEVLDALRGFCALVVVALHFSENYIPTHGFLMVPHGCLPVEFFFALTGFTMVYAYDGRWSRGLTLGGFFKRRLVRLHPLVVIGSIIGAGCYFLAPQVFAEFMPGGKTLGLGQLALLALWCCTLVPQPYSHGWMLLHTLQGPLWTMFYIYLANVLYALFFRRMKTWMFGVLAVLSVALTYYEGVLMGGYHTGPTWNWWWGHGACPGFVGVMQSSNVGALCRMFFPLFAGMLIARRGWSLRTGRCALWLCVVVLSLVFFAPEIASKAGNGLFEATAVVVCMPLVLLLGIGGEIRNARLAAACRFLGKFSFPLYCTHYPMTLLQRLWRDAHPDASWELHLACVCVFLMFAVFNAYGAMKLSDWVSSKVKVKK